MKVLIVEASYPKDFYKGQLDGHVTQALTRLLGVKSDLLYALDMPHLEKAIAHAAAGGYDVAHVSCHGDDVGIAVTNNSSINWPDFVGLFAKYKCSPHAYVLMLWRDGRSRKRVRENIARALHHLRLTRRGKLQ
jgi:hypothetical protein